ncbi:MAG: type II toxin-antitoxin system VapC family toxin [Chloroflexota bacterium]
MSEAPYFLDVNVPMYAAGKDHPYKESCVWVLTEIANGRLDVVIDTEIIQEALYRYGAIQQWQIGVQMAENLLDLVPIVLPVTVETMKTAVSLFAHYAPQGVKARDLLHTAVMQNHQITHIISTDKHFDQIEGVTRLDPQTFWILRQAQHRL